MLQSDFVRFGAISAGKPEVGSLYAQLTYDWLQGNSSADRAYRYLLGRSVPAVTNYKGELLKWGLLEFDGQTKKQELILHLVPNLTFCEDVIRGLYGEEHLGEVKSGKRTAAISPAWGTGHPVADYAVQLVLGVNGNNQFYTIAYPEPNERTGMGRVRVPAMELPVSLYRETGKVAINVDGELSTYGSEVPEDLEINAVTWKYERASKKRQRKLPKSSFAFLYWSMQQIEEADTQYYATIAGLVEHWNDQFRANEKLDRVVYSRLRNLLVEQAISEEDIRRAFRAASLDTWWKKRAVLGSLSNNPSWIRKLATHSQHDPLMRNTKHKIRPDRPEDIKAYAF